MSGCSPHQGKGQVYGATVRFPNHPDANMHGEVRCIIRTRFFYEVITAMGMYGIEVFPRDLGRHWLVSESIIEHRVTTPNYGEIMVCPVSQAYITTDNYHLVSPDLIIPEFRRTQQ